MAASHHFSKHHGLGNDFLVALDPDPTIGANEAVAWCDRRRGVGADGLLLASSHDDGSWTMVLHNADGGRAELSGNGLRCLGQAVARSHEGPWPFEVVIHTDAGDRTLVVDVGPDPDTHWVRVDMGRSGPGPAPSDRWSDAGVVTQRQVGVDMGNPHLVAEVAGIDTVDMAVVGPIIEAGIPQGCNVHVIEAVGPDRIRVKHWERGVGVTEACGSGACAAAVAANQWGLVAGRVSVDMPGGSATVEIGDRVVLVGPAVHIADVEVSNRRCEHG